MKVLRDYQNELLNEIIEQIPKHDRICVQLSTGGGKTVIFTELVTQLKQKTLILVDSIDLINHVADFNGAIIFFVARYSKLYLLAESRFSFDEPMVLECSGVFRIIYVVS
jgi:late competence protein required for DNA uptake (superfamily II DNA/RNA helicase)